MMMIAVISILQLVVIAVVVHTRSSYRIFNITHNRARHRPMSISLSLIDEPVPAVTSCHHGSSFLLESVKMITVGSSHPLAPFLPSFVSFFEGKPPLLRRGTSYYGCWFLGYLAFCLGSACLTIDIHSNLLPLTDMC